MGEAVIARIMLAAIAAGLFAGLVMTAAQQAKVVPLIVQAETYEGGTAHGHGDDGHSHASGETHSQEAGGATSPGPSASGGDGAAAGGILFGLSRFGGTLLANLVTGAGYGLLLAGIALTGGIPFTVANGLLLGAAGWLAVQLLPAIGLPPALPGFPHADIAERQAWWAATVTLSAAGLYLLFMRREALAWAAGMLLIAAPHIYGAPRPADLASAVPAYLAAEFATAALATALLFWLVLGAALALAAARFGAEQ